MSTLIANPIGASLEQAITYSSTSRAHIGAFYPYLIMIDAPAGTFTFSLLKGAETLFSKSFTSADIKLSLLTSNNFAHAFYPVIPNNPIQLESGNYILRITSSGYVETSTSYLAWGQQFEDIQNDMAYTPTSDQQNSLAFRIKIYKEGIA